MSLPFVAICKIRTQAHHPFIPKCYPNPLIYKKTIRNKTSTFPLSKNRLSPLSLTHGANRPLSTYFPPRHHLFPAKIYIVRLVINSSIQISR